jgi:hypothetical protein
MKRNDILFYALFCLFITLCNISNAQVQVSDKKSFSIQKDGETNTTNIVAPKDEQLQSAEKKINALDSTNKKQITLKEDSISSEVISNKKAIFVKKEK